MQRNGDKGGGIAAANFSISEGDSAFIWKARLSGERLAPSFLIVLEGSCMDV